MCSFLDTFLSDFILMFVVSHRCQSKCLEYLELHHSLHECPCCEQFLTSVPYLITVCWLQQALALGRKDRDSNIQICKKEEPEVGIERALLWLWKRSSSNVCWSCSQLLEHPPIVYASDSAASLCYDCPLLLFTVYNFRLRLVAVPL